MPVFSRLSCLVICLAFALTLQAQTISYSLSYFGARDGLVSSEILSLYQDQHRYLWIGHSAGCSRWDGYSFTNFLWAGNQRIGKTYCVVQDHASRLWIGAEGGLFLYSSGKMRHIKFENQTSAVFDILFSEKKVWMGTAKGPVSYQYDQLDNAAETGRLNLTQAFPWPGQIADNEAKQLSLSPDGTLMITDAYSIFSLKNGVIKKVWTHRDLREHITGLYARSADSIYFSTTSRGLQALENGRYRIIDAASGTGNALLWTGERLVYFATGGLYHFDPVRGHYSKILSLPGSVKWGSTVLLDAENNFWIGTHEALILAKPDPVQKISQPSLEGFDELYYGLKQKNGSLLFGGNRGRIFEQDRVSNRFRLRAKVFPLAPAAQLFEDADGTLWMGSYYQGLAKTDGSGTRIFTKTEGLRDNTNFFFLSANNRLFTGGDGGVSEIHRKGTDVSFTNYSVSASSAYPVFRSGLAVSGRLFFGGNWGLYELRKDTLVLQQIRGLQKNIAITDMEPARDGRIWISTNGDGILLCRSDQQGIHLERSFGEKDGLNSSVYLDLLIDTASVVWAASYKGISRISRESQDGFFISHFPLHQHTPPYYSINLLQDGNKLWIPTSTGLLKFDLEMSSRNFHPPALSWTGMTLHRAGGQTDIFPPSEQKKNFAWNENSIEFHFTGISLSDPSSVRYIYRLKGFDTSWQDNGNSREIYFRSLPPGNYTLEVMAFAGHSKGSSPISCSFVISPPFWKTWWFVALLVLSTTALIGLAIRRREKRIKKREKEKAEWLRARALAYQHQLEIEQVVSYFASSIHEQTSVDELLWDVARNCISRLGFEDCVIYLKHPSRDVLVQKAAWGPKTQLGTDQIINPIEIPFGKGIVGSVAVSGRAEIISDTARDDRYIVDDRFRYSEICVPILRNGAVYGVIDSENSQKNFYTERHLTILTAIASMIADKTGKLEAEQEVRKREVQLISLHRDLATSQLTALRVQMNPHFIFNALNSIQQFILAGDADEANRYLSRFSRLQRLILQHCDQAFISLENELDMLRLYLELEQLRLKGNFDYDIELASGVDATEILIPPMLLQPFVENAIWHGLMPLPGKGRLQISVSLQKENLVCLIRDNGIGREASKKLKQAGTKRQSKGMQLVAERLNLLQQQYGKPFSMKVSDLVDVQGQVSGTEVRLEIYVGETEKDAVSG